MPRKPRIPMTPAALPRQAINLVVALPPAPPGIEFRAGVCDFPDPAMNRRPWPRAPEMLVHVEWAETPMNNGVNALYIEGRRSHWLLWNRWRDDNSWTPRWRWTFAGHCSRKGIDRRCAAIHLLVAHWVAGEDAPGDDGHWINETGLLSVEEVRAIAREVRARLRQAGD
jgi:hypothetical protein